MSPYHPAPSRRLRRTAALATALLLMTGLSATADTSTPRTAAAPATHAAATAVAAAAAEVTQPQDVTVLPGATATFTTGAPGALVYTWYRVATPQDVQVHSNFSDGTYSFTATEADDGAQYYARFLLDGRFVTTVRATLTVGTGAPSVSEHPADATVLDGRRTTFRVAARGTAPLRYTWESSHDEGATWTPREESDGAVLPLVGGLADDGMLVRAVVDNPVGPPATSEPATLHVTPQGGEAVAVSDASLLWGINPIYQGGNPAGNSCNFFSAGTQPEFAGARGDVRVVHVTPDGLVSVSEGTRCLQDGTGRLEQRVLLTHGTGTANPATGEATVRWQGAFSANAYGGLVPWWLSDLALTVGRDGSGTLTATAGGRGAEMENPDESFELTPRPVVVATFQDVRVTAEGIVISPDYAGVDYHALVTPGGTEREAGSAIPAAVKAGGTWGSWPESFVDFQYETKLSTYWHTSGLSADPDKPPFDLAVGLTGAPDVRLVPAVTASPTASSSMPLTNGSPVTFTVGVDDADTVRWERAPSATGPWAAVEGATADTLVVDEVSEDWDATWLRVTASNAAGSASSAPLQVTTRDAAALVFTRDPADVMTIAGSRVELRAKADGFPAPASDGYGVQLSTDDGGTWTDLPGVTRSGGSPADRFVVPDVPLRADGGLLRVTARTADGTTARSRPARVSVVAATGGPQLVVRPDADVDPAQPTTLTVVGAGFDLPDAPDGSGYSLDLGLFDADVWSPGRTGTRGWVATSSQTSGGQLYTEALERTGGWFTATVNVPAGALDPDRRYGVGAFSRLTDHGTFTDTFDDRTVDAWAPVRLVGQTPGQPTPADLPVEVTVPETTTPGPGVLTWSMPPGTVSLGTAERAAHGITAEGALAPVTVRDTRPSGPAWVMSGSASAFTGAAGGTFPASALGWQPALVSAPGGGVAAGAPVAPGVSGLATSSVLVSATDGHGPGDATATAGVSLLAPSDAAAGSYRSVLTLTLVG